jgi:hypothetical protein
VIAIIAILPAMLLLALAKAKQKAFNGSATILLSGKSFSREVRGAGMLTKLRPISFVFDPWIFRNRN